MVANAILIGAVWLSGFAKKMIKRLGESCPELDDTLFGFLGSAVRCIILAFAAIFILGHFGIETT